MTSRRKKKVTSFSLFAFQDIITSVTGIVIIMVLLLTLELVDRPVQADSLSAETYQQLNQSIESINKQIEQFRSSTMQQEEMIREVAKTSSPELNNEIDELKQDLQDLRDEIENIETAHRQLEENSRKIDVSEAEQQEMLDDILQLQAEVDRLRSAIEQVESKNRIVFSVPKGHQRNGWLVVVGKEMIRIAPFGRAQPPIVFRSSGGVLSRTSAVKAFAGWIEDNRAAVRYLLVIIRPRGVSAFDELEPMIREMNIDYGFDLIAEDERVLDPEKGAVR